MTRLEMYNKRNSFTDDYESYTCSYNAPLTRADTALHRLIKEYAVDKSVLENAEVKRQVMQSLYHRPRRIITRGMLALIDHPDVMKYDCAGPIRAFKTTSCKKNCVSFSPYDSSKSRRRIHKCRKSEEGSNQNRYLSEKVNELWNMKSIYDSIDSNDKDSGQSGCKTEIETSSMNPQIKSPFPMDNYTHKKKPRKSTKKKKNVVKLQVLDVDYNDDDDNIDNYPFMEMDQQPPLIHPQLPVDKVDNNETQKNWMKITLNTMTKFLSGVVS